jgi:hypothetical protein
VTGYSARLIILTDLFDPVLENFVAGILVFVLSRSRELLAELQGMTQGVVDSLLLDRNTRADVFVVACAPGK